MPEASLGPASVPIEAAPRAEAAGVPAVAPAPVSTVRAPGAGGSGWISLATVAAFVALWFVATGQGWVKPLFLPSPHAVWATFVDYATGRANDQPLSAHLLASLGRVGAAFGLALVTAVPAGLAMGLSRVARGLLDPPVEFYRPLPPLAYLPLIIIWFGIGEAPKVLLIYLSCFAPLALAARAGVRSVAPEQLQAAASMGATRWQLLRHVVLPATLPEVLTGARIALGFGWTTLVAAEMVAASTGLGQLVLNASNFLRTDIVVMGILVIGAIAYGLDLAMRLLERCWVPWKGRV